VAVPTTRQRSAESFGTSTATRVPAGTATAAPETKRSPTVTVLGRTLISTEKPGGMASVPGMAFLASVVPAG
jgi:hypothetical protein